jgi:hypothetical protein
VLIPIRFREGGSRIYRAGPGNLDSGISGVSA